MPVLNHLPTPLTALTPPPPNRRQLVKAEVPPELAPRPVLSLPNLPMPPRHQVKAVFDATGGLWASGALVGRWGMGWGGGTAVASSAGQR